MNFEVPLTSQNPFEHKRNPQEKQKLDVVKAFEIHGFEGLSVAATMEKKDPPVYVEDQNTDAIPNQDNILADPNTGLMGVFDGVGGTRAGHLASQRAERVLPGEYEAAQAEIAKLDAAHVAAELADRQRKKLRTLSTRLDAKKETELQKYVERIMKHDAELGRNALALLRGIEKANEYVRNTGSETTACVGFVHTSPDGTRWAVTSNIGDSRPFIRKKSGDIVMLNEEDSLMNFWRRSGHLPDELLPLMRKDPDKDFLLQPSEETLQRMGLSKELIAKYRKHGYPINYNELQGEITNSLGGPYPYASLEITRLESGDELFFATDGLFDKIVDVATDELDMIELSYASGRGKTFPDRLNNLRSAAKNATGTYKQDDDIAIVAARIL